MNLSRPYRKLSRTFLSTHISTASAALLVAGMLLLAFEFFTLRRESINDLQTHARIISFNSSAAVVFGDPAAAAETLSALDTLSNLRAAVIFDAKGRRVAEHRENRRVVIDAPDEVLIRDAYRFGFGSLTVAEPILMAGERVGSVVINSGLERVYVRIGVFAGVFVIVGMGSLLVSLPLMKRMSGQVKSAEARLDHLAHYDPVTGLLNRNAFNEYLQSEAATLMPDGRQFGLMLLDIDNFKSVNDTFGHQLGDQLLRQIAERLTAAVRDRDKVFRIGGDEFAVALVRIEGADRAERIARRLFDQFTRRFRLENQEIEAAVSGGISLYPRDASSIQALASNADTAMYLAKRNGKNRFEMFRPEMNAATQQRVRLTQELRRALDRDQIQLAYQVQANADDLKITGVEALLRWNHPELGAVEPKDFIPVAEDTGLIIALGRWTIRAACREASTWRASGISDVRIAVNVSVRQMRDEQLLACIDHALAESGLEPHLLELEITESLLLENIDENIALLKQLRARGINLSIDDFGTGYSSMAYLHQLPIDRLKIDMSFVKNIPGDGEVITTAIIAMAHRLDIAVVAEGVESDVQLDFLRDAGCDTVQGFLLSRPLPAERLTGLLSLGHARSADR
jgi:diguanylate cyclase (GGDEF)-like protein